jgi:hypothetical protein
MGTLKAKINLSGPGARQAGISSRYHDVFTVLTPAGVAQGDPGTMTFAYYVDGIADAIGVSGETVGDDFSVARASVRMLKYTSDGGTPPSPVLENLGTQSFEVLGSQAFGGGLVNNIDFTFGELLTFEVPFEYGVPVALTTELTITLLTDNRFLQTLSNPYREIWGGGVIENIYVDTYNTAELIAIVNEEHPEADVTGVNFDYSPLVMASIPPIPDADFDDDGDIDGADFLKWQRGETPEMGSAEELALWEAQYGTTVPPLSASSATVPEPTTCTFALAALCLAMGRRRIAAR